MKYWKKNLLTNTARELETYLTSIHRENEIKNISILLGNLCKGKLKGYMNRNTVPFILDDKYKNLQYSSRYNRKIGKEGRKIARIENDEETIINKYIKQMISKIKRNVKTLGWKGKLVRDTADKLKALYNNQHRTEKICRIGVLLTKPCDTKLKGIISKEGVRHVLDCSHKLMKHNGQNGLPLLPVLKIN
jgi:hypothetical protein